MDFLHWELPGFNNSALNSTEAEALVFIKFLIEMNFEFFTKSI